MMIENNEEYKMQLKEKVNRRLKLHGKSPAANSDALEITLDEIDKYLSMQITKMEVRIFRKLKDEPRGVEA